MNCSMSEGSGSGNQLSKTFTPSKLTASEKAEVSSENLNLVGSRIEADKFKADIEGKVRIESVQNCAKIEEESESFGAGMCVGAGSVTGCLNVSQAEGSSSLKTVTEETVAGIKTGKGGELRAI